MVNFLDKQNILYDRKYGFRNGKSAEDAVYDFINNINNNSQKNLKSLAVFLDLSKAFDSISHELLFDCLERAGISYGILELLKKDIYISISDSLTDILHW